MVNYGRRGGKNNTPASSAGNKPLMKYSEACRMADKNSKTIVKISQLQVS
jgi:hypothetical protein